MKRFKIFFVSNLMYWQNIQKEQSEAESDLSSSPSTSDEEVAAQKVESAKTLVRLSGVDSIREHFQSMTVMARQRATHSFINQDVAAHLYSLGLWATDGRDQFSQAKLQEFQKLIDVVREGFQKVFLVVFRLYTGYTSD